MEYKGFEIDDDPEYKPTVVVIHKELKINSVWGNLKLAKAYIEGILLGIELSKK